MVESIPQDIPQGKHYVYTLAYPDGRVFYVGKGMRDRIDCHEREARNGNKSYKCNVIRKIWAQGEQVVKTKLAYFESHSEALAYEVALIFFMDGLTNLTYGGEGIVGLARTLDHRRKISEALKGRGPSEEATRKAVETRRKNPKFAEHVRKMTEARRGKPGWRKGVPLSQAARQKMSEARKGKPGHPISEETKRKLMEANKGKKRQITEAMRKANEARRGTHREFSEEHRRHLSEALKGKPRQPRSPEAIRKFSEKMKGRTHSEETKRKMSESSRGHFHSAESRQKMSEAKKGKNLGHEVSEETRRKISAANKGRVGKPQSPETVQKRRESLKGHAVSEETRRKISVANKERARQRREAGL